MSARLTSFMGFTAGVAVFAAGTAFAQTPAAPAPAQTLKLPSVSFSIGTGVIDNGPVTMATGRYTLDRHLVLEGDFTHWTSHHGYFSRGGPLFAPGGGVIGYSGDYRFDDDESGWSAGGNLLFQTTYKRLTWFAGGGLAYAAAKNHSVSMVEGCVAPAGSSFHCSTGWEYEDTRRGWALQAKTGVDFRIAGPMMAYGSIHFTGGPVGSLGASAGVRVVARSVDVKRLDRARVARLERSSTPRVPAASAIGARVRVTLEDGTQRSGTLLSLTDTDVVLFATDRAIAGRSMEARYQIGNVRLVETTHRKAVKGLLWGLVAGAALGVLSSVGCEDEFGYCVVVLAPILGGVGAGVGAAVGGLADRLAAPAHVIYARGGRSAQLIPISARKGGGVGIRVRW